MKSPNIEFINHASVLISNEECSVLTDPWYKDSVFHNGWSLLYENTEEEIISVLSRTSYIYISHEHPDHFNTGFFFNKKYKEIINTRNIKIIFQKTKDHRVANFLKKNGYDVIEISEGQNYKLSKNFSVQIIPSEFYDSALACNVDGVNLINLNDCPIHEEEDLLKFKKLHGIFDILITQFGYAAWKGGKQNIGWRKKAAKEKIETVFKQSKILECKTVIPFASFIYFSNEINKYLNDSINYPNEVKDYLTKRGVNTIFLAPKEKQSLSSLKQSEESLNFWQNKFDSINKKPLFSYKESISNLSLDELFATYKEKLFKKNSKLLIWLLYKTRMFGAFSKLVIHLIDHQQFYSYSIFNGLKKVDYDRTQPCIEMHSQSLAFIFKQEFGYDTLTVNACFEVKNDGFSVATNNFAIGSLNAMGFSLSMSILSRMDLVYKFLKRVYSAKKKIAQIEI